MYVQVVIRNRKEKLGEKDIISVRQMHITFSIGYLNKTWRYQAIKEV